MSRVYVVMGVAGCGKSTIAAALAAAVKGHYRDADDDHPPENIEKMSRGTPLTDEDRWPWLWRFAAGLAQQSGVVIGACSALRRAYRDCIAETIGEPVVFLHLDGDEPLIAARLAARQNHFMPPSLLQSQLSILEPIFPDENAHVINIDGSVAEILADIRKKTGL